ncbi:glycoside hydrolase family 15 protein [Acetobacter musti]|uniref:Glycoside hydrolase family 15 protein n=1 Tax=Acetobacter musti TaxID=864732 RepID=A0ABX0JTJ7_9PROT|nr:glycoside hydrolase family 15 protein [Acetobacter musti]NHN85353.1 glycoside hydrolase family 15 protein [Acetobacter musti]
MDRLIEDYALVSSARGAGLVHRGGTIEWLCMPRFDSEAIFASLLGTPENGEWALCPADPDAVVSRRYLPDTMVLETAWETASGRAIVLDFLPPPGDSDLHELVRIVRGDKGTVAFRSNLRLRFGYGERIPWMQRREGALYAFAGPDAVRLSSSADLTNVDFSTEGEFEVSAGQSGFATLEWFPSHISPPLPRDPYALLRHTIARGREWSSHCLYDGPYEGIVRRSLLTLKALTYQPTGGIVAAPTTSLPEMPGGVRNWDYRYCWLRDAAWTIHALAISGYVDEASAWHQWLMRATAGAVDGLQIMYGLHGERRLTEVELTHLCGYENSRPVRIGNGAHDQLQLDVYGSVIGGFDAARRDGLPGLDTVWPLQRSIAQRLLGLWREPDSGLWEVRGGTRHFVYSKMMCWFAFDRMIASATDFNLDGDVELWKATRDEIHAEICEKGFDRETNSFVQFYGADRVDASLLHIAQLGFLPTSDPRVQGTIARIERDLLRNGFVWRYPPDGESADGLAGEEGSFLACSFWLCDAWVMSGRRTEAQQMFEQLIACANDLGLLAEEYDPVTHRQLGNFPQAFSHFALVHSAHMLAGSLIYEGGRRSGRRRPNG